MSENEPGPDLLSDEDPSIRIGAARALGARAPHAGSVVLLLDRFDIEEHPDVLTALRRALYRHYTAANAALLNERMELASRANSLPRQQEARGFLADVAHLKPPEAVPEVRAPAAPGSRPADSGAGHMVPRQREVRTPSSASNFAFPRSGSGDSGSHPQMLRPAVPPSDSSGRIARPDIPPAGASGRVPVPQPAGASGRVARPDAPPSDSSGRGERPDAPPSDSSDRIPVQPAAGSSNKIVRPRSLEDRWSAPEASRPRIEVPIVPDHTEPGSDPVQRAIDLLGSGDRVQAVTVLQEAVRRSHPRAHVAAAWLGAVLLSTGQKALADEYFARVASGKGIPHFELEPIRAYCREQGLTPLPTVLRLPRVTGAEAPVPESDTQPGGVDPIAVARGAVPPRFQDLALIGTGGMGVVFSARDTELDRTVALKILGPNHWKDQHAVQRFALEARAMARLQHPAILRIFDIHRGDVPFFTMELLEGRVLEALLSDGQPHVPDIIRYLLPVLEALDHCHDSGLVHRDVKPRNIFVTNAGEVRLMDFGIVKPVDVESLTRAGTIIGTPRYMAPEQLLGTPVDRRVDVYALGVTLFQMITGVMPFNDPGDIFTRPVPDVRDWADVPPDLAAVIVRALARDPDLRFQTCRELLQALLPFAARESIPNPTGLNSQEVFAAVVFEQMKDGVLSDASKELIFAVRRLFDIPAEVHQEVFREAQARVRVGRQGGPPPGTLKPEGIYKLILRCHLKQGGSDTLPLVDDVGRLLELPRSARRQLQRELADELALEGSYSPGHLKRDS